MDRPNAIKLGNIKLAYVELLKDVKAMPNESEAKKRAKQRLSDYLQSITEKYGQEIVDEIAGHHPADPTSKRSAKKIFNQLLYRAKHPSN